MELLKSRNIATSYLKYIENILKEYKTFNKNINVHIITKNLFHYDAVSKCVYDHFYTIEGLGLTPYVYANHCSEEERPYVRTRDNIKDYISKDDLVLYHFSIGDNLLDEIIQLDCKKIAHYHGITPPKYLYNLSYETAVECEYGLSQLSLLQNFDAIMADSDFNMSQLIESFSPERKEYYISNKLAQKHTPFIFIEKWDSIEGEVPPGFLYQPGTSLILYVGRRYPHKNIEGIIEFFKHFQEKNKDTCLILAGSEASPLYETKLNKMLDEYNISEDSYQILDNLSDENIKYLMKACHFLVTLSFHEGFGIPLVEAMKFGLPVLTHDSTAIKETLNSNGIIVEKGDYRDLAQKAYELIVNDDLKNKIIDEQKKYFYSNFSNDKNIKNFTSILSYFI